MKTCLENPWQKGHLKKLMEKQTFFIDRISTYHTILKECYATLSYNHNYFYMLCLVSKLADIIER